MLQEVLVEDFVLKSSHLSKAKYIRICLQPSGYDALTYSQNPLLLAFVWRWMLATEESRVVHDHHDTYIPTEFPSSDKLDDS